MARMMAKRAAPSTRPAQEDGQAADLAGGFGLPGDPLRGPFTDPADAETGADRGEARPDARPEQGLGALGDLGRSGRVLDQVES